MTPSPSSPDPRHFVPTRWTLVVRAQGHAAAAKDALSELCATYYQPVLHFLTRHHELDTARDLTHEFFAGILTRGSIGSPDPQRGRFRSWLLGAVNHFLSDQRKRSRRGKRSVTHPHQSVELSPSLADPHSMVSDAYFDREWAVALMNRAVSLLEAEFTAAGKAEEFGHLQPWLAGGPTITQAKMAVQLGVSEGALKVAIHRLRARFRELLRLEILQTVADPADCEDELRHLRAALAAG